MKILVVSDSHGNKTSLDRVILKEKPDAIIHLGDGCRDFPQEFNIPLYRVRGNCDMFSEDIPVIDSVDIGGIKILFTHGHKHNVKFNTTSIYFYALEENAQLALFGHTHMPFISSSDNGPTLFNPGSLLHPPYSYGIFFVKDGKLICQHHSLE